MTYPYTIEAIKEITVDFFHKMTIVVSSVEGNISTENSSDSQIKDVVSLMITVEDPKILIGQGGQTLLELQRILRVVLNKKIPHPFYVSLDINQYKAKKEEYLKSLAKTLAQEVSLKGEAKILPPMPSYERRVLHQELSTLGTVISESKGSGQDRYIVISPK